MVAVVSLIAYTNASWLRKIPIGRGEPEHDEVATGDPERSLAREVSAPKTSVAPPKRKQLYAIGWKPCERTYLVTVKLSAQSVTVASSSTSASSGRRIVFDPTE